METTYLQVMELKNVFESFFNLNNFKFWQKLADKLTGIFKVFCNGAISKNLIKILILDKSLRHFHSKMVLSLKIGPKISE